MAGITGPLAEMLARNSQLVGTLPPPRSLIDLNTGTKARGGSVIVICCVDPRTGPETLLCLEGDLRDQATFIRTAGGRVVDAMRTILVLQTLTEPSAIVVMHHTDCGLCYSMDEKFRNALLAIAPQEKEAISTMSFGEIRHGVEESIKEDLVFLTASPFIKSSVQIVGVKHDLETGRLSRVTMDS